MFCQKCGKEIEDGAKFCDGCGESLRETTANTKKNDINVNAAIVDGKKIAKGFFSKNPACIIDIAKDTQSKIGLFLIIINAVLFAFVSCFNITQNVNYIINSLLNGLKELVLKTGVADYSDVNVIPKIDITTWVNSLDFFLPMALIAIVISGAMISGIYIIFKIKKLTFKSFDVVCNTIGISLLPIISALVINFVFGLFVPQICIYVFAFGILISLIVLYHNLSNVFDTDRPLIEFSIIMLVVLVALGIAVIVGTNLLGNIIEDLIATSVSDTAESMFSIFDF